jgi:hypothetical protein
VNREREARSTISEVLSLDNLTSCSKAMCPGEARVYVEQVPLNKAAATRIAGLSPRSIPPIIHQASKSRGLHPEFIGLVNKWKAFNWSICFHDNDDLMRMLRNEFQRVPAIGNGT